MTVSEDSTNLAIINNMKNTSARNAATVGLASSAESLSKNEEDLSLTLYSLSASAAQIFRDAGLEI